MKRNEEVEKTIDTLLNMPWGGPLVSYIRQLEYQCEVDERRSIASELEVDRLKDGAPVMAKLEFDIRDIESEKRLRRMLAANELCLVIWDIQQYLHEIVKYDKEEGKTVLEAQENIQRRVLGSLADYPAAEAVLMAWE